MDYYHTTKTTYLKLILERGLVPKNGENSKVISDEKRKVFFSEGIEGTIGLAAEFQRKFDETDGFIDGIKYNSLDEFLGESVYLKFDSLGYENEGNYVNGYTSDEVPSKNIKVCLLRNVITGESSYLRDDIIKFMMASVPVEKCIRQKSSHKFESNLFKYYEKRKSDIDVIDINEYSLEEVNLKYFCDNILDNRNDKRKNFISDLRQKVEKEPQTIKANKVENCIDNVEIDDR